MDKLFEEWEAILEADGLGVIEVDEHWTGVNIKQIKGKHKRLDALLNKPDPSGMMTNSPVTARAVETRYSDAESEQSDFDDGLWDDDEVADNAWDAFVLSMTATPKEAEIADRARSYPLGVDDEHRPVTPKIKRLTKAERAENIRARQRGEPEPHSRNPYIEPQPEPKAYALPKHDLYMREQGKPCATADAKSGPLNIVDRPKRDYGNRPDDIRMSPVVDTLGYLPGRGPYQLQIAQRGRGNSDITG